MALSKIDTTNMIEDVPQSKLDNNINFRNIIINGGMDLAQRSTSATASDASYNTCDRWRTTQQSLGVFTQSQSTTVPTGQGFAKSLKMDCTTADASPAVSDRLLVEQRFEGQNLQYLKKGTSSAESLTCSFWVRSNKTGTYIVNLYDAINDRAISKSYTISSADTWEKKTITFAGDTTGTLGNDNATSFRLNFWLAAVSNFTSGTLATNWETETDANKAVGQVNLADSTANEWYITGIQLETGTSASDFEFLPHDVNLDRCYRYYHIGGCCSGRAYSTSGGEFYYAYPKKMRSSPSITLIDGTTTSDTAGRIHLAGISGYNITSVSISSTTSKTTTINYVASGLTSGASMGVLGNPVSFSAEL